MLGPIENTKKFPSGKFPWWLSGKESACNAKDTGSILVLERSPGVGNGNPLQYSCLENPMNCSLPAATCHKIVGLDESERGDEKVGLKLNIQKTKIMTSGPITSSSSSPAFLMMYSAYMLNKQGDNIQP